MGKTLLYEFIQNFIQGHDHGIFLLPVPTGYGKTYSSIDYITDQVIASHADPEKPKFVFVTNLKKNLKEEDFREMFAKKGCPELFEKEFFFLKNNVESIIQQYGRTSVPKEIRNMGSYKLLGKKIAGYQAFGNTDPANVEVKNICRKMVSDAERDFRNDVHKYLLQVLKKSSMKNWEPVLKNPDRYPEYKWIFDLFPAAYLYSKSVFAMSMDKFLLPIDPVFGKSFCLYEAEKDFYKNRIIFLDEIDASKEVMVNRIVEDEVSHYVNQIELFVKLHDCFEKQSFHSDLLQKKKSSFADDIQKLYKKGHEIFVQYNLKNGNIQISKEMKAETDFLFHDGTYFTALNRTEGHSYYSIDFDEEKNCNIISVVTGEKPENELGDLIRRVRNFIYESVLLLTSMADAFLYRENCRKGKEEHLVDFENALQIVAAEFVYLSREESEFILKTACELNNSRLKSSQHVFDGSFYENGFALNEFLDDEKHLLRTEIGTHQIHLTPEKIMAETGARYRLVGMSATAELQTDLKNYHWRFVKKYLKEDFVSLNAVERKKIEEDYLSTVAGYEKIDLKAIAADVKVTKALDGIRISSGFSRLFEENGKIISELQAFLKNHASRKLDEYQIKRYARLFCAYMEFLENSRKYGMDSMLYLSMRLPKENDPDFDLAFIKRELKAIQKMHGLPGSGEEDFFVVLSSEDYDAKRDRILQDLSAGKRRFILSSYKTVGAGQNLDFLPPGNRRTIRVGKGQDARRKKDIDSIFLEAPTMALKTGFTSEQDQLAAIIEREYLKANGEYSNADLEMSLKQIIGKQLGTGNAGKKKGRKTAVKKNTQLPSVRKYYDMLILQALGRISRSAVKSPVIRIYVSDDIFQFFFKKEILHDRIIPSPELNAVFALCEEKIRKEPDYDKEILAAADVRANEFSSLLSNWIYRGRKDGAWRESVMAEYRKCGELSLECLQPELSRYEQDYQNFYIELPYETDRYYYNYSEDYQNIRISMHPQEGTENFPYCVSILDSRIDLFLKWGGFREYMDSLGYQTEFLPVSRIWPSPAAFNNIYKGRAGEVFGKFLFQTALGIGLEEITDPESFELFDFKVKDKNVYVDFKNRKDSVCSNEADMVRWIRKKKDLLGNVSVIICNIYEESGEVMEYKEDILTIPSLVKDFEKKQLEPRAAGRILEVCHEDK